jgi:hypothetical protein
VETRDRRRLAVDLDEQATSSLIDIDHASGNARPSKSEIIAHSATASE